MAIILTTCPAFPGLFYTHLIHCCVVPHSLLCLSPVVYCVYVPVYTFIYYYKLNMSLYIVTMEIFSYLQKRFHFVGKPIFRSLYFG